MANEQDVLEFWFTELSPKDWWVGGEAVDAAIRTRFGETVEQALRGELYPWRATLEGRLAEILCLDQFTRNIFRGTARAFAGDAAALILCQELTSRDLSALTSDQQSFAHMPLMHSESLTIHALAAEKYAVLGHEQMMKSLKDHTAVIAQFGRYPSRNKALGRPSTPQEAAFLKDGPTWGQG